MRFWVPWVLLAFLPMVLTAQPPFIYARGVVNAATYAPAGLPAGSIARGSIFTIFGAQLGPSAAVQVSSFPIGTTLSGVSIQVTQGTTTVAVLPLYVSAGQINALMPSNAPLGLVSYRVTVNNARSNPSTMRIVNSSPGIFSINGAGLGPGVFLNFVASDNQPVNSTQVTAKPGQVVTAYGTGLGPVSGADNVAPTPANLPTAVEVTVGGQVAKVLYSGRSPCCSGLDQIVFEVPSNSATGCWVPVYVRTEGSVTSTGVTMAIDPEGSPCSTDPVSSVFLNGGRGGILALVRTAVRQDIGVTTVSDTVSDDIWFDLAQHKGGSFSLFPPSGSCSIYGIAGDWLATGLFPVTSRAVKVLDAGALSITGPRGQKPVQPPKVGAQGGHLGSSWSAPGFPSLLYLDPGNYRVSAAGGADVQAFQASLTVAPPFTWTNRDQLATVDRSRPLTVTWSGTAPGDVLALIGAAVDLPTNSSGVFVCTAPAGASSLTVPPAVLSALPASRTGSNRSKATLYLTNGLLSNAVAFSAGGLDAAAAVSINMAGRTVTLK